MLAAGGRGRTGVVMVDKSRVNISISLAYKPSHVALTIVAEYGVGTERDTFFTQTARVTGGDEMVKAQLDDVTGTILDMISEDEE